VPLEQLVLKKTSPAYKAKRAMFLFQENIARVRKVRGFLKRRERVPESGAI